MQIDKTLAALVALAAAATAWAQPFPAKPVTMPAYSRVDLGGELPLDAYGVRGARLTLRVNLRPWRGVHSRRSCAVVGGLLRLMATGHAVRRVR